MIKRILLILFMVVIAVSLAGGSWAAKEPPDQTAARKAFEAYQRALNTASVQYVTKDGEKDIIYFKKIKGKWMLNGSPISFWTEEEGKTEE